MIGSFDPCKASVWGYMKLGRKIGFSMKTVGPSGNFTMEVSVALGTLDLSMLTKPLKSLPRGT